MPVCAEAIELQTPLESSNRELTNTQTYTHTLARIITMRAFAVLRVHADSTAWTTEHFLLLTAVGFVFSQLCCTVSHVREYESLAGKSCKMISCRCVCVHVQWYCFSLSMHIHIDEQLKRNYSALCALVRASASLRHRHRHRRTLIFIFNLFCVDLLKMFCTVPYAMAKLSGFAANYKRFMPTMMTSSRKLRSACMCVSVRASFGWSLACARNACAQNHNPQIIRRCIESHSHT